MESTDKEMTEGPGLSAEAQEITNMRGSWGDPTGKAADQPSENTTQQITVGTEQI